MAQNMRTVTVFRRRHLSSFHLVDPCSYHPIHIQSDRSCQNSKFQTTHRQEFDSYCNVAADEKNMSKRFPPCCPNITPSLSNVRFVYYLFITVFIFVTRFSSPLSFCHSEVKSVQWKPRNKTKIAQFCTWFL